MRNVLVVTGAEFNELYAPPATRLYTDTSRPTSSPVLPLECTLLQENMRDLPKQGIGPGVLLMISSLVPVYNCFVSTFEPRDREGTEQFRCDLREEVARWRRLMPV